jgi:hypothetical protein
MGRSHCQNGSVRRGLFLFDMVSLLEVEMKQVTGILLLCLTTIASMAMATVIRVPSEYPTVQSGIDAAVDGDTVRVADGVYTGDGNRDIDLEGKAILVTSENGPKVTIIDCEGSESDQHRGFYFHSDEDTNSVVQGFTIVNGYVIGEGGGIYCTWNCTPKIVGNIITRNTAYYEGGGVCCGGYPAMIRMNTINGNMASWGGGINCWDTWPAMEDYSITGDSADYGTLSSSNNVFGIIIEKNIIAENTADVGGGIQFMGFMVSYPIIVENIIPELFTRFRFWRMLSVGFFVLRSRNPQRTIQVRLRLLPCAASNPTEIISPN